MKPLQAVAVGLLVVALYARAGGWDLLADPVGWLLVGVGAHRLPAAVPGRRGVVVLAGLALVVSVPLAVPAVVDALDDADPSLAWALLLPGFGATALLLHRLGAAAADADDAAAARWLRALVTATLVVAVAPVVVLGGGQDQLGPTAGLLAQLVSIVTIVALLRWSGRRWAADPDSARPRTAPR